MGLAGRDPPQPPGLFPWAAQYESGAAGSWGWVSGRGLWSLEEEWAAASPGRQRGVLWEASMRSPEGRPREAEWAGGVRAGPAQVAGLGSH